MAKTALVTGSTSGIGHAIAEALGAAGYNVMLHGSRSAELAEDMRARLARDLATTVCYHAEDLSKRGAVASLIAATESALGPIDVLVNNAGIQHVSPVEDFPDDQWDAILAIN